MIKHSAHVVGNLSSNNAPSLAFNKYFLLSITIIFTLVLSIIFSNYVSAGDNNKQGSYLLDKDKSDDGSWLFVKKTKDVFLKKYPTIQIDQYLGLGGSIIKGELLTNTENCAGDCEATFKMDVQEGKSIVSKIDFYKIDERGNRVLANNLNHGLYIKSLNEPDSSYVPYELSTKVMEGSYIIKLTGQKSASEVYDWVITSNGMDFSEWAIWGMGYKLCYQESANTTNQTNRDAQNCGLNYTGSYVGGDGERPGSNYLYITYNQPPNALNSSFWQIKVSNISAYNLSIPSSCWTDPLLLRIYSSSRNLSYSYSIPQCYNDSGLAWINVGTNYSLLNGAHGTPSAYGIQYAFDGNWSSYTGSNYFNVTNNNWSTISVDYASIFEEAMWWHVNVSATVESVITFNATTYETKREQFLINITWDNVTFSSVNVTLFYNNTKYYPYSNKSTTNQTIFVTDMDIPLVSTVLNNTFYWTVNFTDTSLNSFYINTSYYNQTVTPIYFARCNATNTRLYLNVSFLDEITSVKPAEILAFTTNFSIGNTTASSVKKLYTFNSGSELNSSFLFCFSAPSESVVLSYPIITYSATTSTPAIAERTWSEDIYLLGNRTNNLTLLSLSTGNPVYITVQDTTSNVLQDVSARITTMSGGTSVTVGADTTDMSGQVVFYLSSAVDYTLFLNKTGCLSRTIGLRPYYVTYTYQLDCGNAGVPLIVPYIGASEGLSFRSTPPSGPIYGSTNFGLRVYSTKYNINAIRMDIMEVNSTIRATSTKVVDNVTCYPQDCIMNLTFDDPTMGKLKARYMVNITMANHTTGWYILEQDAYYTKYINVTNNQSNMKNAWRDFRAIFDDWNSYSGTAEEANRAEFSRIVFIFLILSMLLAAFNKFTGYDSANPGAFLAMLTVIFWLGSLAGGRSCENPGFFYLDGLFGADHIVVGGAIVCSSGFFGTYMLNNYIIAITVLLIFLTYILNVQRRNS
jgi:hypothetical protein